MSDASHPPVDGAEPRSAPDPVADPSNPGQTGAPEAEPASPVPEPGDGEALAPGDERAGSGGADEGLIDVAAGAGIGGTEADGGDGDGDELSGSPRPPSDEASRPAADAPPSADLDVSSGAGIGGPDDPAERDGPAAPAEPAASVEQPSPATSEPAPPEQPSEPTPERAPVEASSEQPSEPTPERAPVEASAERPSDPMGDAPPVDAPTEQAPERSGGPAATEAEPLAGQPPPAVDAPPRVEAEPVSGGPAPGATEPAPSGGEPSVPPGSAGAPPPPAPQGEEHPAPGAAVAGPEEQGHGGHLTPPGGPHAPTDEHGHGHHPTPPGATHSPTLPPPPPELAEVPTDAGHVVGGRVREISGDDVVVDLEDGRVGVINRRNLGVDGDPSAALSVGDPIEGAVLARSDPQHRVVLSRTWALKKRAWEAVSAAAAEGAVLTGKVVSAGQKGVVVDVGVRGFVPASHLELSPVTDLQAYAGQELALRVLDVDVDRERLVLSRRSLLLKEQRRSLHDVLSSLQAGEVRRGRVASLSDYGAFVDLGGVNGLVHLSELSWQRVRHPSEVVSVGDEVDVKVLDVKVKKRRVSLSIRQLSDDPLGSLVAGEIRSGPVTRLVDFGAFVDLSGVEGLVHLSELAEYRVSAPEEIVAPGEEVRVKVLSVDRKRRRVELSIRQAAEYGG